MTHAHAPHSHNIHTHPYEISPRESLTFRKCPLATLAALARAVLHYTPLYTKAVVLSRLFLFLVLPLAVAYTAQGETTLDAAEGQ